MKFQFTKMHGLGNDFIVVDGRKTRLPNPKRVAKDLCRRRLGIGADQLLILKSSKKADFRMEIYNADGGQVEMCGNGIRCMAKFIRDLKVKDKQTLTIETLTGIQTIQVLPRGRFLVDMGKPILKGREIPVHLSGRVINRPIRTEGREFRVTCVSMGNPHAVVFSEDIATLPVEKQGPMIEKHHLFPKKTNVEFVKVVSDREIQMRVWERGAGETLACGSGACAAVVAAVLNGFTEREVKAHLPGGALDIAWDRDSGHVRMIGPAETVFSGEIEI